MSAIEIIVIVGASAFVLGVLVWSIVRKKKGKGCLGCDCTHCNGCSAKKQDK